MSKPEAFDIFYTALNDAIVRIEKTFYNVKLVYFNQTIYRENVYCFELYHQLRKLLADEYIYSLSGKVDKASHPDIVERCLEFECDFLIHQPGVVSSEASLAIMNVCSLDTAFRYHETLIEKFKQMNCATSVKDGYYRGIMLIYGNDKADLDRGIYDLYKNYCRDAYQRVLLLYHNKINEKPVKIIIE
jgi:hypothetical protein